ncbi:MAG: SRPBCC family protein [Vicinamibacterales bacterium]
MRHFEVRRTIAASPDRVWAVLTDARALVAGGLGLTRLDGTIAPGARLKLWSDASPGRAFALRVREFTPHRRMVWEGGMPLGLFRGVRHFTLTPAGAGTEFHMREEFTGLLAPLIGRSLPDLTPSFEKFASGLQALAEERTR